MRYSPPRQKVCKVLEINTLCLDLQVAEKSIVEHGECFQGRFCQVAGFGVVEKRLAGKAGVA
jgi:hypothetical protein